MAASKKLFSHIQPDKQDEFHKRLLANSDLFERLVRLIDIDIEDARKKQISDTSYSTPAWSERQADLNGYQRALEEIKLLLNFTR